MTQAFLRAVRLRAASKCACFSFAQLQGPLSCDRGPSTQFRIAWSCTSAWRTQLEPSRTAPLLLSAALRHLEPQPRLRLGVRRCRVCIEIAKEIATAATLGSSPTTTMRRWHSWSDATPHPHHRRLAHEPADGLRGRRQPYKVGPSRCTVPPVRATARR